MKVWSLANFGVVFEKSRVLGRFWKNQEGMVVDSVRLNSWVISGSPGPWVDSVKIIVGVDMTLVEKNKFEFWLWQVAGLEYGGKQV